MYTELTIRSSSSTLLLQDPGTETHPTVSLHQPPLSVVSFTPATLPPPLKQTVKTLSTNITLPVTTRNNVAPLDSHAPSIGEQFYESLSQTTNQIPSSNAKMPFYNEPLPHTSKFPNSKSLPTISKIGSCVSEPSSRQGSPSLLSVMPPIAADANQSQSIPDLCNPTTPLKYRQKKPLFPPPVSNKSKTMYINQTGKRISVDGEYVCPNAPVVGQSDLMRHNGGPANSKADSSKHYQDLRRDNREYISLYMQPTNQVMHTH